MNQNNLQPGYSSPLFVDDKPRWTDDRLQGGSLDKISTKYHDKETTLRILNGLCSDPFFRAEEVNAPWYGKIPDCAAPAIGQAARGAATISPRRAVPELKKPLDSAYKKRTYVIGKEMVRAPAPQMRQFRGKRKRR